MFPRFFCLILLSTSCSGPKENLKKQEIQLDQEFAQELADLSNKTAQKIGWVDAKNRLLRNNLELKRARESVRLAKEQLSQVYWDLIPVLNLRANLSQSLENLGEVSGDDIRFSVFSTFNLPGLVSLYSKKYAALLAEVKSSLEMEIKRRQLIIRLYELFLAYEDFRQRVEIQKKTKILASSEQSTFFENLNTSPEGLLVEQQIFEEQIKEEQLILQASSLLGSFENKWILVPDELPDLNYETELPDFNDTKNFGILLRKRQALELEAARLGKVVSQLSFFPDINFGVYNPPIYASWVDNYSYSADRMIVTAGSSVALDTNLRKIRHLKSLEKQLEFQNLAIKEERNKQISEAYLAKKELELVEKELSLSLLRMDISNSFIRANNLEELREFLERRYLLTQRISSLRMRKARIEGAFWLLDEKKWKSPENDLTESLIESNFYEP